MTPLTIKQETILAFMLSFQNDNSGRAPTLAEVGEHMGTTKTTVREHIRALVKAGYVEARGVSSMSRRYRAKTNSCPACGRERKKKGASDAV